MNYCENLLVKWPPIYVMSVIIVIGDASGFWDKISQNLEAARFVSEK